MLELKITCQSHDEARVYLNAHQYHNLLSDLLNALRNARKYEDTGMIVKVVDGFYSDIQNAVDNSLGAY